MEAYIGTICAFGFNYAPNGWAFCNGQVIAISSNAALFSLLGTAYGGNGTSNFGLPNLQGRAAIHQGQQQGGSSYTMGEMGGSDSVTVQIANLPPHTHPVAVALNGFNGRGATGTSPVNSYPASSAANVDNFNTISSAGSAMKPASIIIGATGGTTPITISDPSLVMNFCICLYGIFPSRN